MCVCVNQTLRLIPNKLDHKYRRRHFVVTGLVRFIDTLRSFFTGLEPKIPFSPK